jgi:NADPH:quinone reductase-like Zn-dependent oxidoreductase
VGLNHLDVWTRKGVPGHKFPLPITPGCDIVGNIEEFGEGSAKLLEREGLKKGSLVVLNPGVSCGRCEWCLGGFDPLCPRYGILGETQDGGCAEYINVPVANLIALPVGLTPVEAAALPIPYLTAWTMLMRKAELRPGQVVLIQAGGSGVSVAAIQFAKVFGATVITTVGSDEKVAKARALGADHVIQYRKTPFREEVKKILASYGKKGCDIVVDHVGADTFADSMKCLSWGGKLVTCGATSGADVQVDLKVVFFKNISILGTTMGSKADLIRIVGLAGAGKFRPVVDSVFKMDQLKEAMVRLEQRSVFGKVILTAE